jgi:hypothetical protein
VTAPEGGGRRRSIEFSLGARHVLLAALLVAAGIIAARVWTARSPDRSVAGARRGSGAARVEDVGDGATVFDREGGASGAKPAPGRQVAPGAARGTWELDLGAAADREEAERIAGQVRELGFAAHAVRTRAEHRIAAGPFENEADARRAAERLREALKRAVYVRGPS